MTSTIIGAMVVAVTALSLSGCFDSEDEHKANAQLQSSEKLWHIPPPTTPGKGFKP